MKSTVTFRNVLATASSAAGPSRSCITSNRPLILRKIRAASTPRAFIAHRPYLSSFRPAISSRTFATHTSSKPSSSASTSSSIPDIPPQDTFDIIIIGGGNAGLALTCALRTSPLGFRIVVRRLIAAVAKPTIRSTSRILLLEGGNLDRPRSWTGDADWDNRVSSLTAENVAWLEGIGVWDHVEQSRSCPVNEMIVWANPTPSSTPTLHFPPLGHPMAQMTENINLQRALLRRIESADKRIVEIREGSKVGEMQLGDGQQWVGLRIGEDKWVRGAVVVGADGPNSPVRRFSNIEVYGHAYFTHAVVATLHHDHPSLYPNNTAFQRFLPTGPLAFLPLSPTASTMVWSTRPDLATAYKELDPEALTAMVNTGFTVQEDVLTALNDQILARPISSQDIITFLAVHTPDTPYTSEQPILPPTVTSIPPRSVASFPLRLTHADTYVGDRTVLVGDAAHTIHPLAGQGLNMGLADIRCLANVWESARRTGGDYGARTSLVDYPRERYPANQLLLSTADMLHHIFRSRAGVVNWLRGTGLDVLNELGPIKKVLMGGAGAGAGSGVASRGRSEKDREYGRVHAGDEREGRAGGWPMAAATGLEGWLGFKQVVGLAAGFAGEAAKNGLRRAADVLEKR